MIAAQIAPCGAQDRQRVDARMLKEATVLERQRGAHDTVGRPLERPVAIIGTRPALVCIKAAVVDLRQKDAVPIIEHRRGPRRHEIGAFGALVREEAQQGQRRQARGREPAQQPSALLSAQ